MLASLCPFLEGGLLPASSSEEEDLEALGLL